MLLIFSHNHFILIYLGVLNLIDAGTGSEVFDSMGCGENADILKTVLKQMNDMQVKMTRLEKSEASLKESVSILMEKTTHSQRQVEELTYQVTNLKHAAKEKDHRIHILEDTLAQMSITNTSGDAENANLGHRMDQTASKVINKKDLKGAKGLRQSTESVFFSAYLDHVINNLGQDQPIVYNIVLQNESGSYSGTSGIFHVPTSGVYLFSWSTSARVMPGGQTYDVWVKLVVNGIHQVGAAAESQVVKDDNQGSNTIILRLKKGDEVWTASQNAGSDLLGQTMKEQRLLPLSTAAESQADYDDNQSSNIVVLRLIQGDEEWTANYYGSPDIFGSNAERNDVIYWCIVTC